MKEKINKNFRLFNITKG